LNDGLANDGLVGWSRVLPTESMIEVVHDNDFVYCLHKVEGVAMKV
jgi:hypothetical protein